MQGPAVLNEGRIARDYATDPASKRRPRASSTKAPQVRLRSLIVQAWRRERGGRAAVMVIEIELRIEGNEVHVTASGSRSERPKPHSLGPELTLDSLETFAKRVGGALRKA